MAYQNECVLRDKECNDCGECEVCDLDSSKNCDNCCKCIDVDADFKGVYIDDIIDSDAEIKDKDIEATKFNKTVTDKIN